MTTHQGSEPTTAPSLDRSASRRRRLGRIGMALGLSATIALTAACRRQSAPAVDPKLQAWVNTYRAAIDDMSEAAGGRDKPLKEGCAQALTALESHESRLVDTPDARLSELTQGFVDERKEEYRKCAETGESPSSSRKAVEMDRRVRQLTGATTEG